MVFYGLEKNSLVEWPGKIAAVVFTGGCSFRCPFCYNRDLVLDYQKLPKIDEQEVIKFLSTRKNLLDGVVVTGGEPTIYGEDLINFMTKVKAMGFGVGLETNGSNPEILEKLIKEKIIDFVAMDVKAPLRANFQFPISNFQKKSKYEELAGVEVDLEKIKKSIELIKNSGIDYELRTTVAPLLAEQDILEMAEQLKGVKKFALQVFQPVDTLINPELAKMKFFSREELEEIGQKIKDNFEKFEIRG